MVLNTAGILNKIRIEACSFRFDNVELVGVLGKRM